MYQPADVRAHFVKELYPVAIAVGFLERVSEMAWLKQGMLPDRVQSAETLRMLVATTLIVFGWDWYHRDIRTSPVASSFRYLLDVAIVLAYLVFMICNQNELVWLAALVGIFVLYVVLDLTSIVADPHSYSVPNQVSAIDRVCLAYRGALSGRSNRIPVINVSWLMYLLAFIALYAHGSPQLAFFVVPLYVGLSLCFVWHDSNFDYFLRPAHVAGYGLPTRCGVIAFLLAVYWLYYCRLVPHVAAGWA